MQYDNQHQRKDITGGPWQDFHPKAKKNSLLSSADFYLLNKI
jgi:hypothetical protein